MSALAFDGVTKHYRRGRPPALDGLSFEVPEGSLCGFVGPNGAGKTTTFSIVSGFLSADAGRVQILGDEGFDPWRLKGRLGVLPQDADLGERHSPLELVTHLARLQGLSGSAAAADAERVLAVLNLGDRRNDRIGTLSHGMRRRVAVASAIVGSPELVLLDEPTAGLDPAQARDLRQALRDRPRGQTLVVSSHNLAELERLCDWIVMIDRGRLLRQGTVHDVTGRTTVVEWHLGPGVLALEALRAALPGHQLELRDGRLRHIAPESADLDAASLVIARLVTESGLAIRGVRRGMTLEQSFLGEERGAAG